MTGRALVHTGYSGRLLMRQFVRYSWTSALAAATVNISAIIDGIIVATFLDSTAVAVQNMGQTVHLAATTIASLIGIGGSLIYANLIGEKKTEEADKVYTVSIIASLALSVICALAGYVFLRPLADMLCPGLILGEETLLRYFGAQMLLFPVVAAVQTLLPFMPVTGGPKECALLSVSLCVVSLALDIVFIRFFGMGVEGTVFGAIVANLFCLGAAVIMIRRGRVRLRLRGIGLRDFAVIGRIMRSGIPPASNQMALSVKNTICVSAAVLFGGTAGAVTMSVCSQVNYVFSTVLETFTKLSPTMLAMLRGQNDVKGIRMLKISSFLGMSAIVLALTAGVLAFPEMIGGLYNVQDTGVMDMVVFGLRVFALHFVFRYLSVLFAYLLNASGKTWYAAAINVAESAVVFAAVETVLTKTLGITGLWMSFPVNSILILLCVLAINLILLKKRGSPYQDIMLTEKDVPGLTVFRQSFGQDDVSIDAARENIHDFCVQNAVAGSAAVFSELAVEEMGVYTKTHSDGNGIMDVIVRLDQKEMSFDFRSIGRPADPLVAAAQDDQQNVKLLRGIASRIDYSYAFGINSTRITVSRNA